MIVPDVNLLLHAVDAGSPHHDEAAPWWRSTLRGPEPIGLPWTVVLAFVRLTTNPRVFRRPLSSGEALDIVQAWTARSRVIQLEPTSRHLVILRHLLDGVGTAGSLVADAHLAALAIEHGAQLCSADADFSRFPGLRWHNPIGRR